MRARFSEIRGLAPPPYPEEKDEGRSAEDALMRSTFVVARVFNPCGMRQT
jgi:hypothetical protein